jgi:hypothetical protein
VITNDELHCSESFVKTVDQFKRTQDAVRVENMKHAVVGKLSSLARQPYVGPGLPQKLLPAKVFSYIS